MWHCLHRLFFLLVVSMLLAACAGAPQSLTMLEAFRTSPSSNVLKPSFLIENVPFNSQQEYQCGPAAIATLLQYSGVDVSADDMVAEVYLPSREGSLQPEMLAAPRRFGRVSVMLPPSLEAVLFEVQNGRPVLVMQNLGLARIPQWHYAVIIGFDLNSQEIILHSGTVAEYRLSLKTFERTWQRVSHWAFVVLKPGDMASSSTDIEYMDALLAFARVAASKEVLAAYLVGLERWPNNELLGLGLANTYYERGELAEAVLAYRDVIFTNPESASAHNNLAQALMGKGELEVALTHANKAVFLGGNFEQLYLETLRAIKAELQRQ